MMSKTLIAAGLLGLSLAAQPVLAQEQTVQTSRTVSLAGLELASADGQAQLDARLRRAARAVCDTGNAVGTLGEQLEAHRCYRAALQSARTSLAMAHARTLAAR